MPFGILTIIQNFTFEPQLIIENNPVDQNQIRKLQVGDLPFLLHLVHSNFVFNGKLSVFFPTLKASRGTCGWPSLEP